MLSSWFPPPPPPSPTAAINSLVYWLTHERDLVCQNVIDEGQGQSSEGTFFYVLVNYVSAEYGSFPRIQCYRVCSLTLIVLVYLTQGMGPFSFRDHTLVAPHSSPKLFFFCSVGSDSPRYLVACPSSLVWILPSSFRELVLPTFGNSGEVKKAFMMRLIQ